MNLRFRLFSDQSHQNFVNKIRPKFPARNSEKYLSLFPIHFPYVFTHDNVDSVQVVLKCLMSTVELVDKCGLLDVTGPDKRRSR